MSETPRGPRVGIKGPLMFSAVLAAVTFFAVLFFSAGGTAKGLRFDLAFSGAGIAFIVCLVAAAMLSMSHKENAEHLGQGSGVNLRSSDRRPQQSPGQAAGPGHGAATPDSGTQEPGQGTVEGESR